MPPSKQPPAGSARNPIPRVTGVTMEPRAAVGSYDPGEDKYTLMAGSGGVVRQKSELAVILAPGPRCVVAWTSAEISAP